MVYKHAYLNTLLLLHSAFMLSVVKIPLKGEVVGHALNIHGNYIVDHGKSWKNHGIVFLNFYGNPEQTNRFFISVLDSTTAKGRPASEVAAMILQAVQGSKSEITPAPLLHRLIIALRALFPNVFFKVMNSRANKQRSDYIKQR